MLLEEVKIGPHSHKLRPPLYIHHVLVKVIDLSALHGKQEGRVCGDDELASEEAGGVLQEFRQLLLA